MKDIELRNICLKEEARQNGGIELIASENYPSREVREACSSILMAKYAEGYPEHRYYGGCVNVDAAENLAMERAQKLFHCRYANVQSHSGSQANYAAYHAVIRPGDKVMSLILNDGGHLTHGSPVSFSSEMYRFVHYPLGDDGKLDYEIIAKRLDEENPNLFERHSQPCFLYYDANVGHLYAYKLIALAVLSLASLEEPHEILPLPLVAHGEQCGNNVFCAYAHVS